MYVTEDTTRADPATLRRLYRLRDPRRREAHLHRRHRRPRDAGGAPPRSCACAAGDRGRRRGRRHRLARPPRSRFRDHQQHRGARGRRHAVHGAALGIGERVGNTPMDLLLVNLVADGVHRSRPVGADRSTARRCREASGVPIPRQLSRGRRDAFRTATGVHAAAVVKAWQKRRSRADGRGLLRRCRPASSAASRRSKSARCRASRTSCSGWRSAACRVPTTDRRSGLRQGEGVDDGA